MFFLPQKPYNLLGSLRTQITYPSTNVPTNGSYGHNDSTPREADKEDELLLEILRRVKLDQLATRMGAVGGATEGSLEVDGQPDAALVGLSTCADWSKLLSLGEQQRLSFARVLYNKPSFVILDESTSALDLASEEAMYSLLHELNVTYVSVGHRPSLLKYHNKRLVLKGPGMAAEMTNIEADSTSPPEVMAQLLDSDGR